MRHRSARQRLLDVSSIRPAQEEPDADEARFRVQSKSPWSAGVGGFNVHAGVTLRTVDCVGLEHLLRYAARAPVALSRLSRRADGRVAYRFRKPRNNGATHRVMTPVGLLAKIASRVPPLERPLLRLSGILGPGSSCRPRMVPRRLGGARHAHGGHASPSAGGVDNKGKGAPAARAAAQPQAPVGDAAPNVATAEKEPGGALGAR